MKEDNQLIIRLEKRRRWKWKAGFAVAGLFLLGGFGVAYFSGSDGADLGSAGIVSSWNELLGGGSAIGPDQAGDVQEVGLDDQSSTFESSSSDVALEDDDYGGGDNTANGSGGSNAAGPEDGAGAPAYESPPDANPTAVQSTKSSTANAGSSSAKKSAPVFCPFPAASSNSSSSVSGVSSVGSHQIILNEIAWMGSVAAPGETSAKASESEWIELKNISAASIDASGWQVLDAAGNIKIILPDGARIPAGGFYLLTRGTSTIADAAYAGGMSNSGDVLAVFDANCVESDFLDASTGWPGGDNATKETMERNADAAGWHTSATPGGTPRAENSIPAPAPIPAPISASIPAPTPAAISPSTTIPAPITPFATNSGQTYIVSVSFTGGGIGAVSSKPSGIVCGFVCEGNFEQGTAISFTATPETGSQFKGWSGPCSGDASCSFNVTDSTHVVAEFEPSSQAATSSPGSTELAPSSGDAGTGADGSAGQSTASPASVDHLLIAQIQIGGASSANDFVKIFNPTGAAIDVSGWKLHKKSGTGVDYSLRDFPAGSSIAAGGYFTWANSSGGFSASIGADVSSTETLSADNSVALFNGAGAAIDEVAWGTGANQYGEGSPYPTDPIANQTLARISANGSMQDTDNNAADFAIR